MMVAYRGILGGDIDSSSPAVSGTGSSSSLLVEKILERRSARGNRRPHSTAHHPVCSKQISFLFSYSTKCITTNLSKSVPSPIHLLHPIEQPHRPHRTPSRNSRNARHGELSIAIAAFVLISHPIGCPRVHAEHSRESAGSGDARRHPGSPTVRTEG